MTVTLVVLWFTGLCVLYHHYLSGQIPGRKLYTTLKRTELVSDEEQGGFVIGLLRMMDHAKILLTKRKEC